MAGLRENRPELPDSVRAVLGGAKEAVVVEPAEPVAIEVDEAPAGSPPVRTPAREERSTVRARAEEPRTTVKAPVVAKVEPAAKVEPKPADPDFDPFTSDIDDPIFKADEAVGGLTQEELLKLPEGAKKTVAAMRRAFTQKTQALADDRRKLEEERKVTPAPAEPSVAHLDFATGSGHAPLDLLLGKNDDWATHNPLPEKLAIDDLSDDDLYEPAKLRAAMRSSIDVATQHRTRGAIGALLAPYQQQQEKTARAASAKTWIEARPGMEDGANRRAVMAMADAHGLDGAEGMDLAYKVWRSENPVVAPKVEPVAPVVTRAAPVPTKVEPAADPEVVRLRAENATLQKRVQSPMEVLRGLAGSSVGKGGTGAHGHLPKMPEGLSPVERMEWLRDHPDTSAEIRQGGLKGRIKMREQGRL